MPTLEEGSRAPDFQLPDPSGRLVSLGEILKGGPAVLIFFKISCPTCQYALPFWERLAGQLQGSAATIWAVSQDSPEHTRLFNEEFGVGLPQLFDGEEEIYPVSEAYGITFVPTAFLVNQQGIISSVSLGFNKKEMEDIAARLAAITRLPAPLELFRAEEKVPLVAPGCSGKN